MPPGASLDDIKRAYRHMALEVHPDANPGDPAADARFRQLTEAYEALAALAPDPPDDAEPAEPATAGRGPIWNVFTDQAPGAGAPGAPDPDAGRSPEPEGTPEGAATQSDPQPFDRGRAPLVELPPVVADVLLRILLATPPVWVAAGLPGYAGRAWGAVPVERVLLSALIGVAAWFFVGAVLWSRAPAVPRELARWRSPGWDGTALLVRLVSVSVLAYATVMVGLRLGTASDSALPPWRVLLSGALLVAAWIVSAQLPRWLGYESRYERYWRMDATSLPPRTYRSRRRPPASHPEAPPL